MLRSTELFAAGMNTSNRRSAIVVTIMYTNCNGSGSAAYPGDNTKTIFTTFMVKRRRTDVSTSVIASPIISLLGSDPFELAALGSVGDHWSRLLLSLVDPY